MLSASTFFLNVVSPAIQLIQEEQITVKTVKVSQGVTLFDN